VNDTIRISTPSLPENLKWVYSISQTLLKEIPLDERTSHFLLVAISEGFTNAVVHGNDMNPDKWVQMTFRIGQDFIRIEVEDEGVLPIHRDIAELTELAGPEEDSGRGLALIKDLVDEVSVETNSEGGNRLVFTRYFENQCRTEAFN